MIIAVGALTLLALVGWRARLSPPAVAGGQSARTLQAACTCEHCVSKGNTVSDCESFGSDCACYSGCPCASCVRKGNTVEDCESFGADCSCYGGGAGGGGGGSICDDFDDRTAAVNDECCDEPTEDCSSGRPATCNLGCAHVLLPFFDDCSGALGEEGAGQFADVVALCHAAEAGLVCHAAEPPPPPPPPPPPLGEFSSSYVARRLARHLARR